jgi:hypothetical protein
MASTTIKKIESITLNGSNKYAGGYIYNISFKPSFSGSPSEIQVNVINETGAYTPPKLDLKSTVQVKIGKLDLGGFFLYRTKKRNSSQGNILELYLIDPTFVLDKFFLGLVSKHGWTDSYKKSIEKDISNIKAGKGYTDRLNEVIKSGGQDGDKGDIFSQTDNLILIGRLFHPCDTNKDNKIDYKEDGSNLDFCDPCPHCPPEKFESKCFELSSTRIFGVAYSFKDFVDNWTKIKFSNGVSIGIETPNLSSKNSKTYANFFREHTGTIREVLSAWCNDFGLNWYYDFKNKKIKFIDLSSKEIEVKEDIIINKYKDVQLISYDLEETIENTEQRGSISWYEREGQKKAYDCNKAEPVSLAPVYAADYFGNRIRNADTATGVAKLNSNDDAVGAILCNYNQALRDAFWFRTVYECTTPTKAAGLITDLEEKKPQKFKNSNGEELIISKPFTMQEMGDMKILAVVPRDPVKGGKETAFSKIAKDFYPTLYNQLTTIEQETFNRYSGYFIIAYFDEDYYSQRIDMEKDAFNFMGRFFMREHLTKLCGITGNQEFIKNNTQVESADGSAGLYSKEEGIGTNPLSKYKYYQSGCLGCMMGTGNLSKEPPKQQKYTKGGSVNSQGFNFSASNGGLYLQQTPTKYKEQDGPTFSSNIGNQVPLRVSQTNIILEREPSWSPTADEFMETTVENLTETNINLLAPALLGGDGKGSDNKWILEALGQTVSGIESMIKVLVAYPGGFTVESTNKEKHPTEKTVFDKPKNEQILRRIGGKFGYDTKLGLLNNTCSKISFILYDTKGKPVKDVIPSIYTPPHVMRDLEGKEIIKSNFNTSASTPCDACLGQEGRPPGYKVFVTQNFSQSVVIPKIQTGVASGIKAPEEVMNFNINYHTITNDDLIAYTGYRGYGCVPNLNYLKNINDSYAELSFQNKESDKTLSVEIKGLPDLDDIATEMQNGLNEININVNDQGISSNLVYGTKLMREINSDLIKFGNENNLMSTPKGL